MWKQARWSYSVQRPLLCGCSQQWVMLTHITLMELSPFPSSCCWPRQNSCFCGVTLLRSLLARNPVFVQSCLLCLSPVTLLQDTHPLSLWEHAAGHLKALSGCKLPQLELWQISQGTTEYDSRDPEWLPEESRHSLKLKEGDCKQAERMSCFQCLLQPLQMSQGPLCKWHKLFLNHFSKMS